MRGTSCPAGWGHPHVPSLASLTGFLENCFLVLPPLGFYLFSILAHVSNDIVVSVIFSISLRSQKQTTPLHKRLADVKLFPLK